MTTYDQSVRYRPPNTYPWGGMGAYAPPTPGQPAQPPGAAPGGAPASNPTAGPAVGGPTTNPGWAMLTQLFPWMTGLDMVNQIQQWIVQYGNDPNAILAAFRQSPSYDKYFAGNRLPDGTLRYSEAQYMDFRNQYQQLYQQYGQPGYDYSDPKEYSALFQNGIDPTQLKQRLDLYNQLETSSNDVRNAFYVYAGMKLDTDTLYSAIVDPERGQQLMDQYNAAVAKNPLDYNTWISRATEAGLENVTRQLTQLQQQGVDTGQAIQNVTNIDPNFARQMTDLLYHGGAGQGPYLSLTQLTNAMNYALIGGAASAEGLSMPGQARIDAMRQAGITRDAALQGYSQYAASQNLLGGEMSRAGLGTFSQDDFEKAVFLHDATAIGNMSQAQAFEKSLGTPGGSFGFQSRTGGLINQPGFGPPDSAA